MSRVEGPSVVMVGSINEDVVLQVDRHPRPGETVTARSSRRTPGGKGANQAVAAARAGAAVTLLGCVGADAAGDRMLAALRQEKVGTELIIRLPDVPTGAAYIAVTPDGENTIIVDPGANARLAATNVEAAQDAIVGAGALVAQLEMPLDAVAAAVRIAAAAAVRAVVNLAPAQPVSNALLSGLDPAVMNESEAAFYLGVGSLDRDAEAAARRLVGLGPRSVVITLGSRGAAIADRTGSRVLPAVPVGRVVDTTGAGDAFSGAMAAVIAGGAALDEGVAAGLRSAAEVIGRWGAR